MTNKILYSSSISHPDELGPLCRRPTGDLHLLADVGDAEADEDEDDDEDEDIDEPWLDELSFASSGLVSGASARNSFIEATSGAASLTGSSDELDGVV